MSSLPSPHNHSAMRRIAASVLAILLSWGSSPTAAHATPSQAVDKAETVYVYGSADGSVREVSSTVVLVNDAQSDHVVDKTDLTDIDSEQSFTRDPNTGNLTWQADGKEVQYRGSSSNQPPIAMHVSYTLDGSVIAPAQLAGKSGHLVIRYDFENTSWRGSLIDGSLVRVYTPFVAVASISLPHSVFHNVTVENGKLTDGSSSSMVIGYAFPGLQESLDLDADDADIPDHFVIEADVTELELDALTVIVTPELLKDVDTSSIDTAELSDSMDALQDAVTALSEGSGTLTDALNQIADGEDQLVSGIDEFKAQASALPEATGALASGATSLASGIGSAADGADGLAKGAAAVRDAVDALKSQALPPASETLAAATAGIDAARRSTEALDAAASTTADGIGKSIETLQGLLADEEHPLDDEQTMAVQEALDTLSSIDALDVTDIASALDATDGAISGTQLVLDGLEQGLGQVLGAAEQVTDGAESLSDGLDAASEGATSLSSGLTSLDQSAPAITQGLEALKSGASQLSEALRQTADGSAQLTSGIGQLGSEGIDKLVEALDGNLGNLTDRVDAVSAAAAAYDTFSGKTEGTTSSVTFIYKLDAIEL